ncbi:hypothetical protein FHS61_000677 [Altererythrobacter atlanticus]|uniref:Naphthalene 1,2-dioxygenase subunit alpha n=1 Tax=Croceibacterium atlanticum TaxID=1267766 RepID=A0A0F7KTL2_9SPHN|nr:SRPBCC family protein [Croceibacterium atlanticum]AKH42904.2 Naphthalene 1,2-dioxygenase subunit alpha [Croceibacterium atlanticum]MBB5731684.1 hypothetical protein [Croceibacterium atlanticum]
MPEGAGFVASTRYGHGAGVIYDAAAALHRRPDYHNFIEAKRPEVAGLLGEERARLYGSHMAHTIFPNCSFLYGTNVWKVWMPRGPHEIEVWTWTMVEKDMPPELKRTIQKETMRGFATAGTFETDDTDNFQSITDALRGRMAQQGSMDSTLGLQYDTRDEQMPGKIGDFLVSEIGVRGFYSFYKDVMEAGDWEALKARRVDDG